MSSAIGPLRRARALDPPQRENGADATWRDRLARGSSCACCRRIHGGQLTLVEGARAPDVRRPDDGRRDPLRVTLEVRSPRFYRALLRGSVGLCEAYMEGLWDCADLVALTRLAALNVGALDALRRVLAPVLVPLQRWMRWCERNTPARSRRQIAAHYDLGNELFALMLDPTMMYSCAIFESPTRHAARRPRSRSSSGSAQARPRAGGPRARDRHRLGRLRDPRRPQLRLPRDDDDDLARAARLRARARARSRPGGPRHGAARGLPRPARQLRQARLDRDDRGRRLAVLRDVLPPLLAAAAPTTARCCCRRS